MQGHDLAGWQGHEGIRHEEPVAVARDALARATVGKDQAGAVVLARAQHQRGGNRIELGFQAREEAGPRAGLEGPLVNESHQLAEAIVHRHTQCPQPGSRNVGRIVPHQGRLRAAVVAML